MNYSIEKFEVEIPSKIDYDSNIVFAHIFAGVMAQFSDDKNNIWPPDKSECNIKNPTHSRAIPSAIEFLDKYIPKKLNPVQIMHKALLNNDYFLCVLNPGQSKVTTPLPPYDVKKEEQDRILDNALETRGSIDVIREGWKRTIGFNQLHYERIFGQIMSAVLHLSVDRGFNTPLWVNGFCYRRDDNNMGLNYLPEGLERGTIIIRGGVGESCGKHSEGGTIVVNENTGSWLGNTARNVNFYINGDVLSIANYNNCHYIIRGEIKKRKGLEKHLTQSDSTLIEGKEGEKKYNEFFKQIQDL